jgi:hypothetical protein
MCDTADPKMLWSHLLGMCSFHSLCYRNIMTMWLHILYSGAVVRLTAASHLGCQVIQKTCTAIRAKTSASRRVAPSEMGKAFPRAWNKCQTGAGLFTPPPCSSQQPVCDADDFGRLLPVPSLVGVFYRVVDDAPFLVKLKQEQASELVVASPRPRDDARNLLDHVADLPMLLLLRLSARFPLDNQLLVLGMRRCACSAILHHALRQDLELDVADYWHSAPRHGRCPQCCRICNLAADGWEMRVCRREEVEADVRREYVLREWRY